MVLTVLVAGLAQLLIVGWGLRRAGLSLRWRRPSLDGDVRMLMLRILPGLMLAGAGHFNMVVAAQMSSSLPSAVSWLYYADRLFQLPLGFVAAAIGTVLLPVVSRALSAADHAGARAAGGRAIEFGFMLVLPAALSLVVLADPIVTVIYRHGAFSSADAKATAEVLRALAFALPGFVLVKALLPPYLARENIRTPLVAALAGVLVNIAVTLSLIGSLGHVAAPLGVAASAFVNAGVLAVGLRGTGDLPFDAMSRRNLAAIALASFATAGVAFLLQGVFDGALMPPAPFALRAATLAAICVAGVVVHAACLFALGLTDRARIVAAFRRPPSPGALSE